MRAFFHISESFSMGFICMSIKNKMETDGDEFYGLTEQRFDLQFLVFSVVLVMEKLPTTYQPLLTN